MYVSVTHDGYIHYVWQTYSYKFFKNSTKINSSHKEHMSDPAGFRNHLNHHVVCVDYKYPNYFEAGFCLHMTVTYFPYCWREGQWYIPLLSNEAQLRGLRILNAQAFQVKSPLSSIFYKPVGAVSGLLLRPSTHNCG